jgi:hypothetical protein
MTTRDDEAMMWLGERMYRSLADGAFGKWRLAQFPAFMLGLFDLSQGRQPSVDIANVGEKAEPYSAVFDAWNDEARLADAIMAMCDYHVAHSEDSDDEHHEFVDYPFSIFPAEVHALVDVRRRIGLSTPSVSHPLLEPPLNRVPENIPVLRDPMLDAVKVYG